MTTPSGDPSDPGANGGAGDGSPAARPPQRVSGMRVPEGWRMPGKPADLNPAAEDAWRQTGFLLGDDLRLIGENLELQAALAKTGYAPAARTMIMAGFASLWSRAFLSTSDAVGVARRGGYQSAIALIRQAAAFVGAEAGLVHELDAWRRWTHEAYRRDDAARAIDVGVGRFLAGEAVAGDAHLRAIHEAAGDFADPHLGPTAMFAAADATRDRYPLVFADEAFHLGWAQLALGWALRVGVTQLDVATRLAEHFPAADELRARIAGHAGAVEALLSTPDRCRLEEAADAAGRRRHLLVQFRRRPADAPKRLLF